ncbi:hypothetical protein MMC30_000597 [Trapelia coarctata]|nr:hypothetical protein [Trapelia coarctata]
MAGVDSAENEPFIADVTVTTSGAELIPINKYRSPTAFIWALTFTAGISGLLFGYDTGVISSTLVSIGSDLSQRPLTTLDKSLITSSTSFFALVASPITGILADKLGRKWIIIIADVLFTIGALLQSVAGSVWIMILGRSIVGLAVGAASLVVPLYISELAPSNFRGRLVTLSILFITFGQMVAYLIGWKLSTTEQGWRWMVGLGAAPAALQFGLILLLPETPRWLMKAGQTALARNVLRSVYGTRSEAVAESVLRAINIEILNEEVAINARRLQSEPTKTKVAWLSALLDSWAELLGTDSNQRALTIACLLQGLQQLCGFNSLMYFSATIFSLVGFDSPTLASLSVAVTNCVFTVVAILLIDRIGRRRILLFSIPIMVLGLLCAAISFSMLPQVAKDDEIVSAPSTSSQVAVWPLLILVSIVIYVSSYALGLGNVPWQQSELFPLSVRSLGSGVATSTNWGSNFVIGLTFLPMMQLLTPPYTFATYALICALGWACVWRIYPETKGLSLEEVGGLLKDGWGV